MDINWRMDWLLKRQFIIRRVDIANDLLIKIYRKLPFHFLKSCFVLAIKHRIFLMQWIIWNQLPVIKDLQTFESLIEVP